MITNIKIIMINRPVEAVFAYLADAANGPRWQSDLVEARQITKGPLGVGSKFSDVRKYMDQELKSVMQYTSFELNKKVVFKGDLGRMPFVQAFQFEQTPFGTRLMARLELQTPGQMDRDQAMIASGIKRSADESFGILKGLLEDHDTPAPQ